MKKLIRTFPTLFGIEQTASSHHEKLISAVGSFIAILMIIAISEQLLGKDHLWLIVPSLGASAVLLFAVPHGQLSQPWPLFGGHLISAFIGVTFGLLVPDQAISISLAVGFSVLAMYYLKCIHPPGGATALSAVLASQSAYSTGYEFMLIPVLLNTLVIFLVAVWFNWFFKWRRYPAFLSQSQSKSKAGMKDDFDHDDFIDALKEIDSFVDINEYDLRRILKLVNNSHQMHPLRLQDLKIGHYYSNGKPGKEWSIRQITDEDPAKGLIFFKQIVGQDTTPNYSLTEKEFLKWSKYEIVNENGLWRRKLSICSKD